MAVLKKEVDSEYCIALKGLKPMNFTVPPAATVEYGLDNSKNNFKETLRVIQRNLLRCHPLIHRPAVHLRSKLSSIRLKPPIRYQLIV